ncbi:hypothetical protein PR202_gb25937 [Eleusine coracana subsp. coracana]|nr:hypothetical protein PR202_gb25937 [Eleusine coracana subsp. coracana]
MRDLKRSHAESTASLVASSRSARKSAVPQPSLAPALKRRIRLTCFSGCKRKTPSSSLSQREPSALSSP